MTNELTSTLTMLRYIAERSRTTVLWWILGVAIYTVVNIAVYPAFEDSVILDLENFPEFAVNALGLTDLSQIGPYLYAQVFLLLPLVLAFLPINAFAGAIAGMEERGGLDVILTQPVKRRSYVIAHWIVAVASVALVLLVTGLLSWVTIKLIDQDLTVGDTLQAAWSVFPVTIAVGSIGLVLSSFMRSRGAVLGASIGIVFLLYLLDVIANINTNLEWLSYISPFRYFGDVFTFDIPVWHYLLLIGVSLVLLGVSIRMFNQRDVYT